MENQQKKVNSDDEREIELQEGVELQDEADAKTDVPTNGTNPAPSEFEENLTEESLLCKKRLDYWKEMIHRTFQSGPDDPQPDSSKPIPKPTQPQGEPSKKKAEGDDFLDSLNPQVLITSTPATDETKQPMAKPDLKAITEAINKLTLQDILELCTPSTGAIPKQIKKPEKKQEKKKSKQDQGSQATANIHNTSPIDTKNPTPTNVDAHNVLIQGICSAFDNARLNGSNPQKDPVLSFLNGKNDKGVGPMFFNTTKLVPKDKGITEEVSSYISQISKEMNVIPPKLEEQAEPKTSQAASKTTTDPKESSGSHAVSEVGNICVSNKGTDEESNKKKKKNKSPKCLGPMPVTMPVTTYVQLRKRLDREPICKVIFGHIMINVYTNEELSNVQKYYDQYLNKIIPRQFANDPTKQDEDRNTSDDQSEITED